MDRAEVGLFQSTKIDQGLSRRNRGQQPLPGSAFELEGRAIRIGDYDEPPQSTEISNGQFADALHYRGCFSRARARNDAEILV